LQERIKVHRSVPIGELHTRILDATSPN